MKPYYDEDGITIYHGDCFDILHDLDGIGAVITDPPYSSGGAFRGDRAQQTSRKYVNSGTAAYRPEFAGDNRDQRSFLIWSTSTGVNSRLSPMRSRSPDGRGEAWRYGQRSLDGPPQADSQMPASMSSGEAMARWRLGIPTRPESMRHPRPLETPRAT